MLAVSADVGHAARASHVDSVSLVLHEVVDFVRHASAIHRSAHGRGRVVQVVDQRSVLAAAHRHAHIGPPQIGGVPTSSHERGRALRLVIVISAASVLQRSRAVSQCLLLLQRRLRGQARGALRRQRLLELHDLRVERQQAPRFFALRRAAGGGRQQQRARHVQRGQ